MPIDDDVARRHREALIKAVAAADRSESRREGLMQKAYLHPDAAREKIDSYRAAHGSDALDAKLQDNERKTAFGRRPGSILDRSGYEAGGAEARQQSYEARRELPEAVRAAYDDEKALEDAVRTYEATGPSDPAFEEFKRKRELARAKDRDRGR